MLLAVMLSNLIVVGLEYLISGEEFLGGVEFVYCLTNEINSLWYNDSSIRIATGVTLCSRDHRSQQEYGRDNEKRAHHRQYYRTDEQRKRSDGEE